MDENVLGKQTMSGREWAFRQLRRFYAFDPSTLLFRALRDLWNHDEAGQPLLAALCALCRDPVLRISSTVILEADVGTVVGPEDFDAAIEDAYPGAYKESTRRTTAQKVASSWAQAGHLVIEGPKRKVRTRAACTPATVAYALMLGHLQERRGQALFETLWARLLDRPASQLAELAATASQLGMIEFRYGGGVVEVGFSHLLRPFEDELGGDPVSHVTDLLAAYRRFVSLPWQENLAPPQRVWMAVYPPDQERRIRLHVPEFKTVTTECNHGWALIDITTSFEWWMAAHEYRDAYFEDPDLLESALPAFFDHLVHEVREQVAQHSAPDSVVALLGAGTLFGLGDAVKVSALLNSVNDLVAGRLLVFFPGEQDGNSYRLLDARDGWNYMAIPITASGGTR
jgi:hypothetical protein